MRIFGMAGACQSGAAAGRAGGAEMLLRRAGVLRRCCQLQDHKAFAACLCLVIIGSFVVPNILDGNHDNPNVMPATYPYVMVNDVIYLIDPEGYATSELPDEYLEIGKVEGNASADKAQNWYSRGCKVGEVIYQSSDIAEVFVYTTLLSGSGEYRYIRFVQFDE